MLRVATVAASVFGATGVGLPCAGAGPAREPVIFGDQTNIIIWDEEKGVEHFIRNANFRSGAANFGCIAPTPSKPEISEASSGAYYMLGRLEPRSGGFGGGGVGGFGGGAGRGSAPAVEVVQIVDVSGYQATTLRSRDASALNEWLNQNGYVSSSQIEDWAARYIARGWYLTAFKVTDSRKAIASTGTIRMSFKTATPYNPFYVPHPNIPSKRGTLRVYFVAEGDYDATIGYSEPWKQPSWTSDIPDGTKTRLAELVKIPNQSVPKKARVATYIDNDFPRPVSEDIYFTKKKPAVKEPAEAPAKTIPPVALASLLAGTALLATLRRRR